MSNQWCLTLLILLKIYELRDRKYPSYDVVDDKDDIKSGKLFFRPENKQKIDLPSVELQEAFYAYTNAKNLAGSLLNHLAELEQAHDENDAEQKLKLYNEMIDMLKTGYDTMGQNRRTGLFHSIVIKISSFIAQILKAIRSCFSAAEDNSHNEQLEIGQASHGFFALTTRQILVAKIYEELKDKSVNGVDSVQSESTHLKPSDEATNDSVEQPVAPPPLMP